MTASTAAPPMPLGGVTLADPASGVSDELRASAEGSTLRLSMLRIATERGHAYVTAERTDCPHLWITPVWDVFGGLDGGWRLTHGPTGLAVGGTEGLDVRELRDLARLLGGLEVWACTERHRFVAQAEYLAGQIEDARAAVTR